MRDLRFDVCLGSCVCVLAMPIALPAGAEGPRSLREAYFGHPVQDGRVQHPRVSHFVTEDGLGFVLDRTGVGARMKFDDEATVYHLSPRKGPRPGDVSYYDRQGVLMARMMALGGMMLYARGEPRPAMCHGPGEPIVIPQEDAAIVDSAPEAELQAPPLAASY